MNKVLIDLLKRAETWPASVQDELVEFATELERNLSGEYVLSPEEIAALDAAERSGIASPAEVEAAFARFTRE
ncbi:MAG: hypothetical protein KIT43_06340 [Bauldia sp.]|nr:hypothetical protein [Bauldia sp.]